MQLQFSEAISAYLMKKIREMELIADRNGRIIIPFRYSGVFPDTVVQPDLSFIASKLLQGGADQLLNRGMERLSKVLGSPKTAQIPGADPASSQGTQPAPDVGTTQPEKQVSAKEKRIQQGLEMLSKILEPRKK